MVRTPSYVIRVALILAATIGPAARAQQPSQSDPQPQDQAVPPIPAYRSPLASAADNGGNGDDNQKLDPDTRALAGAETLSLGAMRLTHSFWQPSFNLMETGDSNALGVNQQSGSGWISWDNISAGLELHRISGDTNLSLSYQGGATVANNGGEGTSIYQNLSVSDRIAIRRGTISITDQLSYLPETGFGSSDGGLDLPVGIGLQNGFVPGQSILTGRGQRLANSFVTEVDANLTPRSTITFVGGYSLLHFFETDLLDVGDATFQAGYNYQLTRQDTVAVHYRFSAYRYSGVDQSINDNSVQLSYARRVTGRLAFQIGAGPEIAFSHIPITGNPAPAGATTTSSTTLVDWSLSTALSYGFERGGVGVSYNHGVGGGAGVLAGSESDIVTGTANRQFTRLISASLNVGYARNKGLSIGELTSTAATNQAFDYWFAGVNFTRPWGRTLSLLANYQLQYQNSNAGFCVGATCGQSVVRHVVSVGIGWHDHPITF